MPIEIMPMEKVIDIDTIIRDVSYSMRESVATCKDTLPFFGRITFCFERGRVTHVEKHEVIK